MKNIREVVVDRLVDAGNSPAQIVDRLHGWDEHRAEYAESGKSEGLRSLVRTHIGMTALLASQDPHLNDIPLHHWDLIAGYFSRPAGKNSLGERVCALKEAGRQLIEEYHACQ